MKKFLRRSWDRYSKLGKKRKKKQTWRKPRGRDNKMREKRKGYPAVVSIGYKKEKKKHAVIIKNIGDLQNIRKEDLVIIGKIGKKKKIEIMKKAKEKKINIHNLNVEKFLKGIEKEAKKKEEIKNKKKGKTDKEKKSEKKEITKEETKNREEKK